MIEDKNQSRTSISDLGEFKLIDHLTQNFKIQHKSKKTKKQNIISINKMEKTCKPTSIDKLNLDNYIPKPTPSKDTINNIFSLNNLINDTDKLII